MALSANALKDQGSGSGLGQAPGALYPIRGAGDQERAALLLTWRARPLRFRLPRFASTSP
jgi:hypothetical protein